MALIPTNIEQVVQKIATPEQWAALQELVAEGPMTLAEIIEAIFYAPGSAADQLNIDTDWVNADTIAFIHSWASREGAL